MNLQIPFKDTEQDGLEITMNLEVNSDVEQQELCTSLKKLQLVVHKMPSLNNKSILRIYISHDQYNNISKMFTSLVYKYAKKIEIEFD